MKAGKSTEKQYCTYDKIIRKKACSCSSAIPFRFRKPQMLCSEPVASVREDIDKPPSEASEHLRPWPRVVYWVFVA